MKRLLVPLISLFLMISVVIVSAEDVTLTFSSNCNSGSIWTTRQGCETPQDENHYAQGEDIYIHGRNFDKEVYKWDIEGQPGRASGDPKIIVANGSYQVNSTGDFCFYAYTVQEDDWGEYKVTFNNKHDNYRVPVVPEFGIIIGSLTIVGAVILFFIIRK